jgi:hypothetical protein
VDIVVVVENQENNYYNPDMMHIVEPEKNFKINSIFNI